MKNKIKKIWKKHGKKMLLLGLLCILGAYIVPQLAFAAPPPAPPSSSPESEKLSQSILSFVTLFMEFLQRIIWPVLLLIGGLMKNDILYGSGMEERLLAIWGEIRNLVNILFVLLLLGIAFYNVVGGKDQSMQIKEALPKFVIALIAVNFSYLGVKVVLDTVNIVSTAIFAMPVTLTVEKGKLPVDDAEFTRGICQGIYGTDDARYKQAIADSGESALCEAGAYNFTDKAKQFFERYDGRNAAMVMAINLANIAELPKVFPSKDIQIKTLTINSLFSIVFYIVYATAFVALLIVLIARLIVLWLMIVLSPLMALAMILPEKLKGAIGEGSNLKDTFVQHAIVPIPIALVMTIGFIMLQHFKGAKFPEISLTSSTLGTSLLVSGTSTLQDLVVAIAMVGFIWKGVFDAADKTIAKGITSKLKGAVEGAGKFVGEAWKYAPIFPVYGAKTEEGKPLKLSMAGALGMIEQMPLARQEQARKEAAEAQKAILKMQAGKYGQDIRDAKDLPQLKQKMKNAHTAGVLDFESTQKDLAEALRRNASWKGQLNIPVKMTDASGAEIKNKEDLFKKMADGKVSQATMNELAILNTQGIEAEKAPAEKPVPGAPGAAPKIDEARAGSLLGAAATYKGALNDKEKKALDEYEKVSKDPKAKQEQKDKSLGNAQDALSKIEKAQQGSLDFATGASNAANAGALEDAIKKRREYLKQQTPEAGDDAINSIIRSELEASPSAKANVDKQRGGNATLGGIDFSKPAVAAAPAKPAPAAAKPATPPAPEVIEEIAASDPRLKDMGNPTSGAIVYIGSKKYKVK